MKILKKIKSKFVDIVLSIDDSVVEMNLLNINLRNMFVKFEIFDSSFENVYYFFLIELSNKYYFIKTDFNSFNTEIITDKNIISFIEDVDYFEKNNKAFTKVIYRHYLSLFDTALINKVYVNAYFYNNNNNEYEYCYKIIERDIPFISIQDYYFNQN